MALQVREKERECVRMLPSLVAHAVGYETVIDAHNNVYVQTHLAGSTLFAWYGKRRRLQYCLCSETLGRLHSARLAWPGGTVLKARRVWQGTVLDIAVDFSVLPYLHRLLPRPTPSGRPRLVVPSLPRLCQSGKSHDRGPAYPRLGKEVGVRLYPFFS